MPTAFGISSARARRKFGGRGIRGPTNCRDQEQIKRVVRQPGGRAIFNRRRRGASNRVGASRRKRLARTRRGLGAPERIRARNSSPQ